MTQAKPIPADISEHMSYDPETGCLTWVSGRLRGQVAGCVKRKGYVVVRFRRTGYLAHRIAYFLHAGTCPPILDHADGNRANNRWDNLREATPTQNNANTQKYRGNLPKGVFTKPGSSRFYARIKHSGRTQYLGAYDSAAAAHAAYCQKAVELHGEYARAA